MTTEGSSQVSISTVKDFLTRNFLFHQNLAKNLRLGRNCVTSFRETTAFDVLN